MAFRRVLPPLSTLAPRAPSRNQLLASREKLAREERAAAEQVRQLRSILDDMSNELAQRPIDPKRAAALIIAAGDRARAGAPVKLPPRGSTARLIVVSGMRARGEKVRDDE
jgi:hypothetical protein